MILVLAGRYDTKTIESGLEFSERLVLVAPEVALGELREMLLNGGLFGETKLIVVRDLLTIEEGIDWLIEHHRAIDSVGHHVIFHENKILAPAKKLLSKHNIEYREQAEPKTVKAKDNQVFAITDAVLARDKKGAWVAYRTAIQSGKSPEAVLGALWWQVKNMWQVATEKNQPAGMNSFVYQKTKRSLQKYSRADIEALALAVVSAYHEPRISGKPTETMCEQLLLRL